MLNCDFRVTCCASSSLCWTLSAMCLAAATVKKVWKKKCFIFVFARKQNTNKKKNKINKETRKAVGLDL